MGRPGPATQAKRNRERSRHEQNKEKLQKRADRQERKKERARLIAEGADPESLDRGVIAELAEITQRLTDGGA